MKRVGGLEGKSRGSLASYASGKQIARAVRARARGLYVATDKRDPSLDATSRLLTRLMVVIALARGCPAAFFFYSSRRVSCATPGLIVSSAKT